MLAQGERWNRSVSTSPRQGEPATGSHGADQSSQRRTGAGNHHRSREGRTHARCAAIHRLVLTGARRGELCALRWSDLDWQAGVLTIERSVYETKGSGWGEKPTKTHQIRRVGLDEVALEVLRGSQSPSRPIGGRPWPQSSSGCIHLFKVAVGSEPVRPDVVTKFVPRIAKTAGVDTHLHSAPSATSRLLS